MKEMKTFKTKRNLPDLLDLYSKNKINLQELYNSAKTTELAEEWGMSVPTLVKKLKERGIKTKGRSYQTKELPI
jgi:hypothetical protein